MADRYLSVPQLDDPTVLSLFETLRAVKSPRHYSVNVIGLTTFDLAPGRRFPEIDQLDHINSFLISDANFGYQYFAISYQRGGRQASPRIDEFRVNYESNESDINNAERLRILEALYEKVGPSSPSGSFKDEAGIADLESLYRSTVIKMETAFAQQISKITSWTVEQVAEAERRRLELAEATNKEREALRAEYEDRSSALKATEDELEKKRQELDDRDYMHARRAKHREIQKVIAEREAKFGLTAGTKRLRGPIHAVMLVLISALVVLNILYFAKFAELDLNSSLPLLVSTLVKQGVLAAVLVATILYYVRWMNRWFEEHSSAEFWLKQFQLDVDRASWVVETALEWRRVEKTELPAPLLEGIARNLFAGGKTSDGHTAADGLASAILGNASGLRMKVGDNELSFDRKGISRLADAPPAKVGG